MTERLAEDRGAVRMRRAWLWNARAAGRCRRAVRVVGAGVIVVLLLGILWRDNLAREELWFVRVSWCAFMVRTFGFHIGIGLMVVAAAALLLKERRSAVVFACVGVLAMGPGWAGLLSRGKVEVGRRPTLTVMSVNLLYGCADAGRLAREIERVSPDVVVFQEYTGASAAELPAALGSRFGHRFEQPRDDAFGQAVYSRLPFVWSPRAFPRGDRHGSWRDPQIRAEVEFDGHKVAIMNVHLVPPTGLAFVMEQRREALMLAELAKKEVEGLLPGEGFVVAGDLNATPESEHLNAMRRAGMREARRGRATTWPRTMPLKLLPGVRLDHVLYAGLEFVESGVCGDIGSDHRAVWGRFVVKRQGVK